MRKTMVAKREPKRRTGPTRPLDWASAPSELGRYHSFPWPTADVFERRRLAGELFLNCLVDGEIRSAKDRCVEDVVGMYLRGAVHPATIARAGANLAQGLGGDWRQRTDVESATYIALSAVYRMLLDADRGRPVPKKDIKRFREWGQKIAKVPPFKARQKLAYATLLECARNLCDGSRDKLRLFIQFVISRVSDTGSEPEGLAYRVADSLIAKGIEHKGAELTRTSLAQADDAACRRLLNATLRALGVEPPRSGASAKTNAARKA